MNSQDGSIFGFSLDGLLSWTNVLYLVSVAAALVFSVALWRLSTISAGIKDRQLAEYQARAQKDVTEAQTLSQVAETKASEARAEAAKANERAVRLELEAQTAKLETEKLKEKFAWRALSDFQKQHLTYKLARNPGSVTIAYTASDVDSLYLAITFAKVFSAAKWNVGMQSLHLIGAIYFGIDIPPSFNMSTNIIRNVFESCGLGYGKDSLPQFSLSSGSGDLGNASAVVFIGTKQTHRKGLS